jgi:hypothetical protein
MYVIDLALYVGTQTSSLMLGPSHLSDASIYQQATSTR